jgi:hypothetical protein
MVTSIRDKESTKIASRKDELPHSLRGALTPNPSSRVRERGAHEVRGESVRHVSRNDHTDTSFRICRIGSTLCLSRTDVDGKNVALLKDNGDGTFTSGGIVNNSGGIDDIALMDWDGDDDTDMVLLESVSSSGGGGSVMLKVFTNN